MFKGNAYILFVILFFGINSVLFSQNNTPIAVDDVDTADFNTTLTVSAGNGLLSNDSDPDGDSVSITQFFISGNAYNAGDTANLAVGSLTINVDGSFVFIPANGYSGYVPDVTYIISDGVLNDSGILYLTVEVPITTDLLSAPTITSCNQGYTADGFYKIRYTVFVQNTSIARDSHSNSVVSDIQIFNDLEAVFGDSCIQEILRETLYVNNSGANPIEVSSTDDTSSPLYFAGNSFPPRYTVVNWDINEFSETDPTPGADGLLTGLTPLNLLFPGQTLGFRYCVIIDPACAGSGPIDFDNVVSVTSSRGNISGNLLIPDFHESATTVAAGIYVQDDNPNTAADTPDDNIMEPDILPDGTYQYSNTIVIKNDGNAQADNVNFNLGLGDYSNLGITFSSIQINQVSGPNLNINTLYDGINDTKILLPNNSLQSGEVAIFEIIFHTNILNSSSLNSTIRYRQVNPSMTVGPADSETGFNESDPAQISFYSFVSWTDAAGFENLDRYYDIDSNTEEPSSNNQCICNSVGNRFLYELSLEAIKSLTNTIVDPNIPEHKELTFQLTARNTSPYIQVVNIQLQENLNDPAFCPNSILSITQMPTILSTSATSQPTLNPSFNGGLGGLPDVNIFVGNDGILEPNQEIVLEFKILVQDDCVGDNVVAFSVNDPLNANGTVNSNTLSVSILSDNDLDGISDVIDIDDDNDGIPDVQEYNGIDPLADADNDNIPNYRDLDFGVDTNNDGIIDLFDFDMDGIPNHFDLDSDNDSIYDIVEAGNSNNDTDNDGMTNNNVGSNGLDNLLENTDTVLAVINYTITNTDSTGNEDYIDIDSDNDGIVDVIEAQPTNNYVTPNAVDANGNGVYDVYENLGAVADTDGDNIPDYQDLNSDDDFYDDLLEGWDTNNDNIADTVPINSDLDNDGLDDAFDVDDNNVNPTNGQIPTDFPNLDEPSTIELDWREALIITVTILDQSVMEGGSMTFTATIDNPSPTDIIIEITTTNDTAISPDDFNGVTTPVIIVIPAGTFSGTTTLNISTIDDNIYEQDEVFFVNGNVTSNNTANNPIATGTILNDDPMPTVFITDASADEGDILFFEITLSNPSSESIFINFTTVENTASDGEDYNGVNNVEIEIPPLNLVFTFDISSIDDLVYEPTEIFDLTGIVTSNNTSNIQINAIGTILDNEPYPVISVSNPIVVEGNILLFEVTTEPITYQDIIFNAVTNNGTAFEPGDYISLSQSGYLIPALSEGTQVLVQTNDDFLDEDTEQMFLSVIVTSFNTDNIQATGTGSILDNDAPNLFSPNGDGIGDVFEIEGMDAYPDFTLQIFDRYGSLVYDYQNKGNLAPLWWDGNYKGKEVPEGVYYYVLDYNNGTQKPIAGFIQLIR
jgi:gliding motility-associated-like protein